MAKNYLMNGPETCWVVLAGECDLHDLRDVEFIVSMLKASGVSASKIQVFLNFNNFVVDETVLNKFLESLNPIPIKHSTSIANDLSYCKKMVVIVAGHGSETSIACFPPLSPVGFLDLVSSKCSEVGLIVFGQCYSGIFNHLAVTPSERYEQFGGEFCLIGGTEMTTSSGLHLDLINLQEPAKAFLTEQHGQDWCPNFFLLHTLQWLVMHNGRDVDGDGLDTALDLYKFSLNRSAGTIVKKRSKFLRELMNQSRSTQAATASEITDPALDAIMEPVSERLMDNLSEAIFSEQVPWILNPSLARRMVFNRSNP